MVCCTSDCTISFAPDDDDEAGAFAGLCPAAGVDLKLRDYNLKTHTIENI